RAVRRRRPRAAGREPPSHVGVRRGTRRPERGGLLPVLRIVPRAGVLPRPRDGGAAPAARPLLPRAALPGKNPEGGRAQDGGPGPTPGPRAAGGAARGAGPAC